MPYAGIPKGSELESKIERCVESVMSDQSVDKSSAIAICRDQLGDEKSLTHSIVQAILDQLSK